MLLSALVAASAGDQLQLAADRDSPVYCASCCGCARGFHSPYQYPHTLVSGQCHYIAIAWPHFREPNNEHQLHNTSYSYYQSRDLVSYHRKTKCIRQNLQPSHSIFIKNFYCHELTGSPVLSSTLCGGGGAWFLSLSTFWNIVMKWRKDTLRKLK